MGQLAIMPPCGCMQESQKSKESREERMEESKMIPIIRSLTEIMLTTQSRDQLNGKSKIKDLHSLNLSKKQKDKNSIYKKTEVISLPNIPKRTRRKWMKSKEAVSRFFDHLDYNNQIQSTYDLTLMDRQENYDHRDAV